MDQEKSQEKRQAGPGADLDGYIRQQFGAGQTDVRSYSPLVLAYIGDAAYELVIRTIVVAGGNKQVNKLHRETSRLVKAQAQSAMAETILPLLTKEEAAVYKRGRNAKAYTTAKNASVKDYRRATGFEALMGYLYLQGDMARLVDLARAGVGQYTPNENKGAEARNRYKNNQ